MPEPWSSRDFTPHLHTIFKIETPPALELELNEVSDSSNERIEQFSLLFGGSESSSLPQGTYALHHAQLGEVSLFLVPLGPRNRQMIYQAVFARLVPEPQPPQHD